MMTVKAYAVPFTLFTYKGDFHVELESALGHLYTMDGGHMSLAYSRCDAEGYFIYQTRAGFHLQRMDGPLSLVHTDQCEPLILEIPTGA